MAHAHKPEFVFRRNGQGQWKRRGGGRQFSRLLAAEVCASVVVMLDTSSSEVMWRVLATNSIRQFPLHFPFRASPCAITFQLDCTSVVVMLDTSSSEVVWRVLATNSIRQFPLHFPFRASPCAITFQLDSTNGTATDVNTVHCAAGCRDSAVQLRHANLQRKFWTLH
jgi:hypothetical protein